MLRPEHKIDGDALGRPRTDRFTHSGIAQSRRNAAELQGEFLLIDAARGIDRQNELEIDNFLASLHARHIKQAEAGRTEETGQASVEKFSPQSQLRAGARLTMQRALLRIT